ncbi:hypothetical protein [Candidatus Albibeggiatoa sp. nov. BB20]|uniref:hypothetical protein n=1 Tax=Candidatus Albibeggiatoa sp. nov. BB20 TaxID=3162723 RepID=UPI0033659B87
MLKSYEALYENNQLKWFGEQPQIASARVIVTILEEKPKKPSLSCLELAQRHNIVGNVKDAPTDLSTNKAYLAGYGNK